jgi:glycosyltransferase involved in cell wall biosynthesis
MSSPTRLSVLMPVYNERGTVATAIDQALTADLPVDEVELVLVDDGSTDGTREWLREQSFPSNVQLHMHPANRGKGAAVRTALEHASGGFSTILDADLEYDPNCIASLLEPLLDGTSTAVYGVRGFRSHSSYSFWYVMGNKTVTLAANLLYNSYLSDIMTCHKVMGTELFRSLPLREPGFGIEAEITARLLRAGVRVFEVPITYTARSREEGKKLTAYDGLRTIRTLLRCRLDGRGLLQTPVA